MKNSVFVTVETSNHHISSFGIEEYMVALMDKINLVGCELSILFCENERIKYLNRDYRNKDKVTDVLSFPQNDKGTDDFNSTVLGDIVIATDVAYKQGVDFETGFREELKRLLIHGLLHLVGYDHVNEEAEAKKMREYEAILLEDCGEIK